ncbi:hypothetical protein BC628DRAFT_512460 [Trametes gibbosa]|nr:hypothetical protein BC628DRAFT_512460 [Trametes gibbosa]
MQQQFKRGSQAASTVRRTTAQNTLRPPDRPSCQIDNEEEGPLPVQSPELAPYRSVRARACDACTCTLDCQGVAPASRAKQALGTTQIGRAALTHSERVRSVPNAAPQRACGESALCAACIRALVRHTPRQAAVAPAGGARAFGAAGPEPDSGLCMAPRQKANMNDISAPRRRRGGGGTGDGRGHASPKRHTRRTGPPPGRGEQVTLAVTRRRKGGQAHRE